ncbi:15584_t:CDS:10 [Acaulospora morrowiae]|uniref:histone deacetylase n=1 Tax=Acaulospora morrowiae TaxID=94023 RepID=A0A9N9AAA3_9GLOM|nr:15584_t:CDS:10 [Acaulospora morrowiae]
MKRKSSTITIEIPAKQQRVENRSPSPDFWPDSPTEYGVNDPVDFWPPTPTAEDNDKQTSKLFSNNMATPRSEVVVLITQPPPEAISKYVRNDKSFRNYQQQQLNANLPFVVLEGRVFYVGDRVACLREDNTLAAARILDIDAPKLPHIDPQLQERIFVHFEGWGPEHAKMVTELSIRACTQEIVFGPNGRDDSKTWQTYKEFYSSDEGRRSREHTGVIFDDTMLLHDCPCVLEDRQLSRHPEKPERCIEIMNKFESRGLLRKVKRLRTRMASKDELEECHFDRHVATYFSSKPLVMPNINNGVVESLIENSNTNVEERKIWAPSSLKDKMLCGELGISCDTTYNPAGTPNAARMAAGTVIEMVDAVASGKVVNGFAVVRPPGHHAEHNQAIHGNGTQNLFYDRGDVLYVSLHRYENGTFYPYTGPTTDIGSGEGLGKNVNITFSADKDKPEAMGDTEYIAAFEYIVLPIARQYNPDLVIVSAGFDAAEGHEDGIGGYKITPRGYAYMTQMLKNFANGKLVLALEGGYALEPLSESASACLSALLGSELSPIEQYHLIGGLNTIKPNQAAVTSLQKVVSTLKLYWEFPEEVTRDDFRFALPVEWRAANSLSTRPKRAPKPKKRLAVEG